MGFFTLDSVPEKSHVLRSELRIHVSFPFQLDAQEGVTSIEDICRSLHGSGKLRYADMPEASQRSGAILLSCIPKSDPFPIHANELVNAILDFLVVRYGFLGPDLQ